MKKKYHYSKKEREALMDQPWDASAIKLLEDIDARETLIKKINKDRQRARGLATKAENDRRECEDVLEFLDSHENAEFHPRYEEWGEWLEGLHQEEIQYEDLVDGMHPDCLDFDKWLIKMTLGIL